MALQTGPRATRFPAALPVILLGAALAGCAKPPPSVPPLVGRWQGTMAAGGAAVPSVWEIRADGTQSLTLALPQGAMTAQGTWTAQNGVLTERTTARVVAVGGEPRIVLLASPMETAFAYQLTGDTLTLTRAGTHQSLVLTQERGTNSERIR